MLLRPTARVGPWAACNIGSPLQHDQMQRVELEHLDAAAVSPCTTARAYNRNLPCSTQGTHAIGLWVARNKAWRPVSQRNNHPEYLHF
jgi:hypothetical protein